MYKEVGCIAKDDSIAERSIWSFLHNYHAAFNNHMIKTPCQIYMLCTFGFKGGFCSVKFSWWLTNFYKYMYYLASILKISSERDLW